MLATRQLLQSKQHGFRSLLREYSHPILHSLQFRRQVTDSSRLPRILQSSTWNAVIPKAFRSKEGGSGLLSKKKTRNPATYFIWIYLLIGSQAMRIVAIQNESRTYMRKADLKIDKLREVVEKLQKGESVDVEKALGTGDEIQEREWEDALREIENEDLLWRKNKKMEEQALEQRAAQEQDASPISDERDQKHTDMPFKKAPGFY